MKVYSCWTAVFLMLVSLNARPCGYSFPNDFFFQGGRHLYDLPPASFGVEAARILETYGEFPLMLPEERSDPYEITLAADVSDLKEHMADTPGSEEFIENYEVLRNALADYAELTMAAIVRGWHGDDIADTPPAIPFDITPFEDALNGIPEEFALYIRGAAAFHSKERERAREYFSSLLELDPEQRMYRSVWAAFMLGRTLLAMQEPAAALPLFEQVRALAAEGYRDTLDLAVDSWGWQGRAHYLMEEYVPALNAYVAQYNASQGTKLALGSINMVFRRLWAQDEIPELLVRDHLLRTLCTAWLSARDPMPRNEVQRWLDVNRALNGEGLIAGGELLARMAYHIGDMDTASYWLGRSAPDAPHAQVVRAKLLMREGRIEEGTDILKSLAESLQEDTGQIFAHQYFGEANLRAILPHVAAALMRQDRYAEAVKSFLAAGEWYDAVFVAERIMTIPELQQFIVEHQDDEAFLDAIRIYSRHRGDTQEYPRFMLGMKHLLARRIARAGRWEEAAPWYPEYRAYGAWNEDESQTTLPSLAEHALQVAEHLKQVESPRLSKRERAMHYFEAAKIIRQDGMDLMGALMAPDWGFTGGVVAFPYIDLAARGETVLTDAARKRFEESAVAPAKRFHYRYVAADLMKQCADLLPNNDPLTAEALYLGGMYLQLRDPQAADPFYKALVRRNPNLLIAQQADELRWFPKEFTEVVLYTARPRQFLPRKRTIALWLGAAMLFAVFACICGKIVITRFRNSPDRYSA